MFDKTFLVNRVVNSLLKRSFEVMISEGCFDIAAKSADGKQLLLVKVLVNVDGLDVQQAMSLRAVAYFMSAYPFVVSIKNNREFLSKSMIYSRFDLPVTTPELLESILENEAYAAQASKGRHTVEIDVEALRNKRKEMEYTLEELAGIIGVSKKALYEIEAKRVNPTEHTVKKLEITLKTKLKNIYQPTVAKEIHLKPEDAFQSEVSKELKRIGVDNSPVHFSPIKIVGKEEYPLMTSMYKVGSRIKNEAVVVRRLADIFSSSAFFVAKKSSEKEVGGVPIILEKELPDIDTAKELKKLIKEKQ
jgi:putative transcriptional regulator